MLDYQGSVTTDVTEIAVLGRAVNAGQRYETMEHLDSNSNMVQVVCGNNNNKRYSSHVGLN
jgi:deoxyxylulose-5-phosphate synthase